MQLKAVIPNRASLLDAMAESALQHLLHMVTERVTSPFSESPVKQYQAVADWAGLYPYEFRFIGEIPAGQFTANPRLLQYERPIHAVVSKIFHRAKKEGFLGPDEDPETLVMMSHAYVYGVITRMLLGTCRVGRPGSAIERQRGWRYGCSLTNAAGRCCEKRHLHRPDVVGMFPSKASVRRLVGAILLEQTEGWRVRRARSMTLETHAPA